MREAQEGMKRMSLERFTFFDLEIRVMRFFLVLCSVCV